MLAIEPFIERLRSAGYAQVESLFEFAQLTAPPRNLPALYVVPDRESAEGGQRVGAYEQKITLGFTVVLVMAAPVRGSKGPGDALKAELRRIKDALFGWQHPEASSGCMLAGGRLLDLDPQTLSWAIEFTTHYRERKLS